MSWLIVVTVVVVVGCSLTLNVLAQRTLSCTPTARAGGGLGQCIPLRNCQFFMRILSQSDIPEADRVFLRENRCNIGDKNVQICCPLNQITTRKPSRLQRHPLLPQNCGASKWERYNNNNNASETKIDEYPWLALIEYIRDNNEKVHACGGVLISDRYVLTAAHCMKAQGVQPAAVRLGEWDTLTNPDCQFMTSTKVAMCAPPYQDIAIEQILTHPNYITTQTNQQNDIALIRLKEPAKLSGFVSPICLPNKLTAENDLRDFHMEVGGWRASSGTRMQKNPVIIASLEDCKASYNQHQLSIQTWHICGAAATNVCLGNSGGPLMHYENDTYTLEGILSFGPVPCPQSGWPDVYTRVAPYVEWIESNLRP